MQIDKNICFKLFNNRISTLKDPNVTLKNVFQGQNNEITNNPSVIMKLKARLSENIKSVDKDNSV